MKGVLIMVRFAIEILMPNLQKRIICAKGIYLLKKVVEPKHIQWDM